MSKQSRKPFPHQASCVAKKAPEIVHVDICGPIIPTTHGGSQYFFIVC